jgi:pimeloyl-ACP methyl ester carboxylesterase
MFKYQKMIYRVEESMQKKNKVTQTILMGVSSVLITACMPSILKKEQKQVDEYYQVHKMPVQQSQTLSQGKLSYVESGDRSKPTIILLHGTPGNWSFLSSYVNHELLQKHAHIIAIDRPGWGQSQFNEVAAMQFTLTEQSQILGKWICEIANNSKSGKVLLLGHSYGASLAPKLAMDFPQCVSSLILLAGAADPELAKPRWYNRLSKNGMFSGILSKFSSELVQANKEMLPLKAELELMRDQWRYIEQQVLIVQGGKDRLVHPKHADFLEKQLHNASVRIIRKPKQGHFVLFQEKDMIIGEIIKLLKEVTVQP